MALQFLTIVTFGRSGSTTLQAAANAVPGVLIRGENYAALRGLRSYLLSVAATANRHHAGRPDHPWFGSARLDPMTVRDDLRGHVIADLLRPRRDTRVLGFKEIRYTSAHWPDYDSMLEFLLFLNTLLPGVNYLINTRSAQDAATSAWWRAEPDAAAILAESEQWLAEAADDLGAILGPDRTRHIRYEVWRHEPAVVIDAFRDLGLPSAPAEVSAALAGQLNHGSP